MPISQEIYERNFPPEVRGRENMKYLIYTTYAGDPTNNVTPEFIGQLCLDTASDIFYIAPTLDTADWAAIHA